MREWKSAMGSWSAMRLFTLEGFLGLRRLRDRACLELIQRGGTLSRHARAGIGRLARR